VIAGIEKSSSAELMPLSKAVDDSIRYTISNRNTFRTYTMDAKNDIVTETKTKKAHQRTNPTTGRVAPREDHGDRSLWGRHGAEAWTVAR
jgi:hypothetical protein